MRVRNGSRLWGCCGQPHQAVANPCRMGRLNPSRLCGTHCFRQCTRTIHSAHVRITSAERFAVRRRTPSVRRQSAANSGRSPEPPPSATCCLPRTEPHRSSVRLLQISKQGRRLTSPSNPSALSFPLIRGITPKHGRDATALPRTNCPPWKGGIRDQTFA